MSLMDSERKGDNENMETQNKLLETMLSKENLDKAYRQVKRNKGASGVDEMEVSELEEYLEKHLEEIKEMIRYRKYKPQPVKRVEIPKADGGVRNLGIPTVLDRFVQQAVAQVLVPIYEPLFHNNSYGFRPNRCCEMAIIKALEYMNDGYHWVVDIDLERFFDTVNHDTLITLIMREVKSGEIVSLIRKFLVSGIMIDEEYKESTIGTPQGGNLSPVLSNVLLNELDKEMEARGLRFVRYADDCIIQVGSSKAADRVMESIGKYIEKKLGLKVNMTKSKVSKPNNIKFLGFGFYYDIYSKLWKAKPHDISVKIVKEKLKRLTNRSWSVSWEYRSRKIRQLVIGWVNYYRIGECKSTCTKIDRWMRFRIRMYLWKKWKTIKNREKQLRKLGALRWQSESWSNSRKSYARCASTFLQSMVTNEVLKRKGLVSLLAQYQKQHILI